MSKVSEWRSGVVSRVTSSSQPPSRLAPSALPATADNRNTPCNVVVSLRWIIDGNVICMVTYKVILFYEDCSLSTISQKKNWIWRCIFSPVGLQTNYRCICASRSHFSFRQFPFQHCCANFQVAGDRLPSRYEAVWKEGLMLSHSGTKPK